jgi:hypothetical protein
LQFLRIDSDADISPYGSNRVMALGSFKSQLDKLALMLGVPEPNEIRVLLLHHSYIATGKILVINKDSKAALHDFIPEHDISALLCGHVHQPPFGGSAKGKPPEADDSGKRPTDEDHWPNSFVHRLSEDGGDVSWATEIYLERSDGFFPADQVLSRPVSKIQLTCYRGISVRQLRRKP